MSPIKHLWQLELEAAQAELSTFPADTSPDHPGRVRLEAFVRARRKRLDALAALHAPSAH